MTIRSATLGRVIQTATSRERSPVTDRDLLRRFADHDDQAAFEAVVRRHTGLVLTVCRRALSSEADAEDACQAVFLILARKARAGRWQPSIANWLFATARRVARDLRRSADRRTKREGRAAVPASIVPVDQMTGRELLAVIDEELDRLPPIYREPLLLYYQAELARDEIATRLGVPAGTVKIRLERGRKRLGAALTKRGVTLGAAVLTLMATSPAGASPPRLIEAIRAAVGGQASPTVAALAQGAAVNGIIKKFGLGLMLTAAMAVLGFGVGEPRATTAGPPDKEMPAKKAAKGTAPVLKADDEKPRTISGKVLGPDGKPIAGAELIHIPGQGKAVVLGKSAADGSFSVTVPVKGFTDLFPRAPGLAPAEFLNLHTQTPADVTLKMVKDTPIRGRLVDTQGKPVAGASVSVRSIQVFENESLDDFLIRFLKRPADGHAIPSKWSTSIAFGDRQVGDGDHVYAAATDKDGRFTITGVGSERIANLRVTGPGIATTEVTVLTRTGFDPAPYNRDTLEKLKSQFAILGHHPMLHPPDANIVAEGEKAIRGVVKDTATDKPRAGVTVTLRNRRDYRLPTLSATTDAEGRYVIHGAKKADSYEVSVNRDPATGHMGRTVKAKDTPAYEPVTLDVGVTKGIVLTGRLLDDRTGEPVSGYVCAGVLFDNEARKERPEFDSPDCYEFAYTKADGVFRTIVPPGPVLLMAGIHPTEGKGPAEARFEQLKIDPAYPDYFDKRLSGFRSPDNVTTVMQGQWCKVLKLKSNETEVELDVRFKRASRFEVKVRDSDGKPLTGVTVAGNTARDWASPEECKTDVCPVYELDYARPRFLAFLHPDRKLVGTLTLKGDEKEPVVATLDAPGRVKGRLVDADGKPLANVVVSPGYKQRAAEEIDQRVNGDWRSSGPKIETNANGEFAIDVVIPGESFTIYGRRKDRFLEQTDKAVRFAVKPGEMKDLGMVTVKEQ